MRVLIHPDSNEKYLRFRLAAYGMSVSRYREILADQGGVCAICGLKADALVVDHDHDTGVIRGLLCHKCNSALGHLQDSYFAVCRAADYLKPGQVRYPDIAVPVRTQRIMRRLFMDEDAGISISILRDLQALTRIESLGWGTLNGEKFRLTQKGRAVFRRAIEAGLYGPRRLQKIA